MNNRDFRLEPSAFSPSDVYIYNYSDNDNPVISGICTYYGENDTDLCLTYVQSCFSIQELTEIIELMKNYKHYSLKMRTSP